MGASPLSRPGSAWPEPRVETRPTAALSQAELDLIARHRAGIDYGMPDWGYQWAPKEWRTLAWSGRDLVGHAGIVARTVLVDGRPVPVGGISGVWTVAAHRGRGVGRAVVGAATAFACAELGAAFGLLLCRPELEPYYARLGWRAVTGRLRFDQPGGSVAWPLSAMVRPCRDDAAWPPGEIDLRGLPW